MGLQTKYTLQGAALHVGRCLNTVRQWVASGFLPARKKLHGRGLEILDVDLEACMRAIEAGTAKDRTPKRPWTVKQNAQRKDPNWEGRDKRLRYMREYSRTRKRSQGD